MAHFTYTNSPDLNNLCQGDLLERNTAVEEILQKVHPHFYLKDDYSYFMVVTQSCDLMRRDGSNCSSRYITIAAVRPITIALNRAINNLVQDGVEKKLGFSDFSKKAKLEQFVERLLNNNIHEYFYINREPNSELNADYCAFLRLTVALKSSLHYDALLSSKILQLTDSFQHKLGSLIGNCYSRIGTEDWVPNNTDKTTFNNKIRSAIEQVEEITWLEKDVHKFILKELKKLPPEQQTLQKFEELAALKKDANKRAQKEILEVIEKELKKAEVEDGKIQSFKKTIVNVPQFREKLK